MLFNITLNNDQSYVGQISFDLNNFEQKFNTCIVAPYRANKLNIENVIVETKIKCGLGDTNAELDALLASVKSASTTEKEQALQKLLDTIKAKLKAKLEQENKHPDPALSESSDLDIQASGSDPKTSPTNSSSPPLADMPTPTKSAPTNRPYWVHLVELIDKYREKFNYQPVNGEQKESERELKEPVENLKKAFGALNQLLGLNTSPDRLAMAEKIRTIATAIDAVKTAKQDKKNEKKIAWANDQLNQTILKILRLRIDAKLKSYQQQPIVLDEVKGPDTKEKEKVTLSSTQDNEIFKEILAYLQAVSRNLRLEDCYAVYSDLCKALARFEVIQDPGVKRAVANNLNIEIKKFNQALQLFNAQPKARDQYQRIPLKDLFQPDNTLTPQRTRTDATTASAAAEPSNSSSARARAKTSATPAPTTARAQYGNVSTDTLQALNLAARKFPAAQKKDYGVLPGPEATRPRANSDATKVTYDTAFAAAPAALASGNTDHDKKLKPDSGTAATGQSIYQVVPNPSGVDGIFDELAKEGHPAFVNPAATARNTSVSNPLFTRSGLPVAAASGATSSTVTTTTSAMSAAADAQYQAFPDGAAKERKPVADATTTTTSGAVITSATGNMHGRPTRAAPARTAATSSSSTTSSQPYSAIPNAANFGVNASETSVATTTTTGTLDFENFDVKSLRAPQHEIDELADDDADVAKKVSNVFGELLGDDDDASLFASARNTTNKSGIKSTSALNGSTYGNLPAGIAQNQNNQDDDGDNADDDDDKDDKNPALGNYVGATSAAKKAGTNKPTADHLEQQRLATIIKRIAGEFREVAQPFIKEDHTDLKAQAERFLLDDKAVAILLKYIEYKYSNPNIIIEDLAIRDNIGLKLTQALTNPSSHNTKIIIPYNRGRHFVLFICDPVNKTVFYVDPKGNQPNDDILTGIIINQLGCSIRYSNKNFQGTANDKDCGPLICAYLEEYIKNNSQPVPVTNLPKPVQARDFAIQILSTVLAEVQSQTKSSAIYGSTLLPLGAINADAAKAKTSTKSSTPVKPKKTPAAVSAASLEEIAVEWVERMKSKTEELAISRVIDLLTSAAEPVSVLGRFKQLVLPGALGLAILEEWQKTGKHDLVRQCIANLRFNVNPRTEEFYKRLLDVIQLHDEDDLIAEIEKYHGDNSPEGLLPASILEALQASSKSSIQNEHTQSVATIKKALMAQCFVHLRPASLKQHLEDIRPTVSAVSAESSLLTDVSPDATHLRTFAISRLNGNKAYSALNEQITSIKADIANNRAHAETITKKIVTNLAAGVVFVIGASIAAAGAVPGSLLFLPLGPGFGAMVLGGTILATIATKKTVAWKYDALAEKGNQWRLRKAEERMQTQVATDIVNLLRGEGNYHVDQYERSIERHYSKNEYAYALLETLQTSSGETTSANPRLVAQCLLVAQQETTQNNSAICYEIFRQLNTSTLSIGAIKKFYENNKNSLTQNIQSGFTDIINNVDPSTKKEIFSDEAAQRKALRNWCMAHSPKALIEELLLRQSANNPKAVAENLDYFVEHPSLAATRSIMDFMESFEASTLPDKEHFLQQVFQGMQPKNFRLLMQIIRHHSKNLSEIICGISLQAVIDKQLFKGGDTIALDEHLELGSKHADSAKELAYALNYLLTDFCYKNDAKGNAARTVVHIINKIAENNLSVSFEDLTVDAICKLLIVLDTNLPEKPLFRAKLIKSLAANKPELLREALLQLFKTDPKQFAKRCGILTPTTSVTEPVSEMVCLVRALINGSKSGDTNKTSALAILLKAYIAVNRKNNTNNLSLEMFLQVMESTTNDPDKKTFHDACSQIPELRVLIKPSEKQSGSEVRQAFMTFCSPQNGQTIDSLSDQFTRLAALKIDVNKLFLTLLKSPQNGFFINQEKFAGPTKILEGAYLKYRQENNLPLIPDEAFELLKQSPKTLNLWMQHLFLQFYNGSGSAESTNAKLNRLQAEAADLIQTLFNRKLPRNKENELDVNSDLVKMFITVINAYENVTVSLKKPLQIFVLYRTIMTTSADDNLVRANMFTAARRTNALASFIDFDLPEMQHVNNEKNKQYKKQMLQYLKVICPPNSNNEADGGYTPKIKELFNLLCKHSNRAHANFLINPKQLYDRMIFVLKNENDPLARKIEAAIKQAYNTLTNAATNTANATTDSAPPVGHPARTRRSSAFFGNEYDKLTLIKSSDEDHDDSMRSAIDEASGAIPPRQQYLNAKSPEILAAQQRAQEQAAAQGANASASQQRTAEQAAEDQAAAQPADAANYAALDRNRFNQFN
jgi:hypothetical protein